MRFSGLRATQCARRWQAAVRASYEPSPGRSWPCSRTRSTLCWSHPAVADEHHALEPFLDLGTVLASRQSPWKT